MSEIADIYPGGDSFAAWNEANEANDDGETAQAAEQGQAQTWTCPGCTATYSQGDPDLITGHVRDCDYVDGTGQAYDVTLKWSVIRWHAATVRSPDLAAATGGRPFTSLAGTILDPDDDDPDANLPDYLDELAAGTDSSRGSGDWEISQIYAARRDEPRTR